MILRRLTIVIFLVSSVLSDAYSRGFADAADFGFSPNATGVENVVALQKAVNESGTIIVSKPGTYKVAGTTYIGSNTTLEFGNGVVLQKVNEIGPFSHVILNKGALTKIYDKHITVRGLQVSVNGVETTSKEVFGLRGQIAFFYVKDLKIEGFRCEDIMTAQFGIHVCTFEDLIIDNTILKGGKDGIHLGRGNRFTISNAVLETVDDAIALNAHDYATSNPELGWIENGIIENCYDLAGDQKLVGYFCRILAGAWTDWKSGMEVQNSDAVVSNGRIYRFRGKVDEKLFKSITKPTHTEGSHELDGINWVMVQEDVQYSAGVRNVTFRNIYLEKPRTSFSIHFDIGKYSRSYYPGAEVPMQKQLFFDNVRVLHDGIRDFMGINTPVDVITICNSTLKNGGIKFRSNKAMQDYLPTKINIYGTVFNAKSKMILLDNTADNKIIYLKASSNIVVSDDFSAEMIQGNGKLIIDSDL
jgi:hypothetical protein